MPFMPPTAQKMPLALHVHHMMAAVLSAIPTGLSIGMKMPTRPVASSGSRQYPSTDAERANVRLLLLLLMPEGSMAALPALVAEGSVAG
jgi:hypothetical protein